MKIKVSIFLLAVASLTMRLTAMDVDVTDDAQEVSGITLHDVAYYFDFVRGKGFLKQAEADDMLDLLKPLFENRLTLSGSADGIKQQFAAVLDPVGHGWMKFDLFVAKCSEFVCFDIDTIYDYALQQFPDEELENTALFKSNLENAGTAANCIQGAFSVVKNIIRCAWNSAQIEQELDCMVLMESLPNRSPSSPSKKSARVDRSLVFQKAIASLKK